MADTSWQAVPDADHGLDRVGLAELVARVRSLARRSPAAAPVVARGDIVLDRARRRVSRAGRPVPLNRKELGVLEELLIADGGIRSAEDLFERVWDESTDLFSRTVTIQKSETATGERTVPLTGLTALPWQGYAGGLNPSDWRVMT